MCGYCTCISNSKWFTVIVIIRGNLYMYVVVICCAPLVSRIVEWSRCFRFHRVIIFHPCLLYQCFYLVRQLCYIPWLLVGPERRANHLSLSLTCTGAHTKLYILSKSEGCRLQFMTCMYAMRLGVFFWCILFGNQYWWVGG